LNEAGDIQKIVNKSVDRRALNFEDSANDRANLQDIVNGPKIVQNAQILQV